EGRWIASDHSTVVVEDRVALADLFRGSERIPGVRTLGDDPQHPWTMSGQHQRWPRLLHGSGQAHRIAHLIEAPHVGGPILTQELVYDFDRLAEPRDPLSGPWKLEPKGLVLRDKPPCSDPHVKSTLAHVVDGNGLLRQ